MLYIMRRRVTAVGCVCVSGLISCTVTNRPRRRTYISAANDSVKACFSVKQLLCKASEFTLKLLA